MSMIPKFSFLQMVWQLIWDSVCAFLKNGGPELGNLVNVLIIKSCTAKAKGEIYEENGNVHEIHKKQTTVPHENERVNSRH